MLGKALLLKSMVLMLLGCSPMAYRDGVPNLVQVDKSVWRSGQVTTADGWVNLRKLVGGKTPRVLKLNFDAEGSDDGAEIAGFQVYKVAIEPQGDVNVLDAVANSFSVPNPKQLWLAVWYLNQATPDSPWVVHCTHGQDRTGLVVGMYRRQNGWSKWQSFWEMLQNNFHPELIGLMIAWETYNQGRK